MKGNGPFLNRDFGYQDRPRALFSKLPIGIDALVDYKVYFDDFKSFSAQLNGAFTGTAIGTAANVAQGTPATPGGATPTAANVDTGINNAVGPVVTSANLALRELQALMNQGFEYNIVKDTGASVAIDADAENGILKLTSAATTDNDGVLIQNHQTNFLCKSNKSLWFEARVKLSSAADGDLFVGLADEAVTDPEAVVAATLPRVGFEIEDGSAVIKYVTGNGTAATKTSSGKSAADDTYVKLGFRTEGGSIRFYVNRALVGTASIPSAIAAITLGPSFFGLSGSAVGTQTRSIDYILAVQER